MAAVASDPALKKATDKSASTSPTELSLPPAQKQAGTVEVALNTNDKPKTSELNTDSPTDGDDATLSTDDEPDKAATTRMPKFSPTMTPLLEARILATERLYILDLIKSYEEERHRQKIWVGRDREKIPQFRICEFSGRSSLNNIDRTDWCNQSIFDSLQKDAVSFGHGELVTWLSEHSLNSKDQTQTYYETLQRSILADAIDGNYEMVIFGINLLCIGTFNCPPLMKKYSEKLGIATFEKCSLDEIFVVADIRKHQDLCRPLLDICKQHKDAGKEVSEADCMEMRKMLIGALLQDQAAVTAGLKYFGLTFCNHHRVYERSSRLR